MSKSFNNSNNKNNNDKNEVTSKQFIFSEEVNLLNIDLIYFMDYLSYKKKIIKFIINEIELLTNIFDEEISDILINIFILKKKNKISESDYKIIEPIYHMIYMLDEISYVDQEDLLNIILNLYKINILVKKISIFFENYVLNDLVNFNLFKNKINELVEKISKTNLVIIVLENFFNTDNINSNEINIINQLKNLAKHLSIDFFMYYNSDNIYNKIMNNLLQLDGLIKNDKNDKNDKNKLYKQYNILLIIFKNYKQIFTNEYDRYRIKYLEIYSTNEFDLKIKFKIKKNEKINKLVKNLNFIKEL